MYMRSRLGRADLRESDLRPRLHQWDLLGAEHLRLRCRLDRQ